MTSPAGTRAVVLGGGFAGVLAAGMLGRHVDDVVLVEAGRYPGGPAVRTGVPQAHHNHILVAGGAQALDTLLPGVVGELLAAGGQRRGLTGDALIRTAGGWLRRQETPAYVVSASRWLIDHVVRRRALGVGAVTVREETRAVALTGTTARVTGVVLDDGEVMSADLVVDATGRRSRTPAWLADLGADPVDEETIDSGLCYATRIYRAPAELVAGIPAIMLHPRVDDGRESHGATIFPIEGDRWIMTLTGTQGNVPPADPAAFTDAVAALAPIVAGLVDAAEPLSGVRPYRMTANRRRRFELGGHPAGLVVLGDAVSATNPVYSHGMSVAALSVLRLVRELDRYGPDPGACPRFQSAVADEVDLPWRMATAGDRGPAAPASFRDRLARSPELIAETFRVQTLIGAPADPAATLRRALAGTVPPPLGPDDAVAQFPELSGWWGSGPSRRFG
ncbi:tryptophan 7-halogenase [Actinoplanes sp. NBRC 103695]|uniref:NAD(P)/FAD-dependent oxidoreductase n=1 Tax=Actinoplanes sp. NBRC 103695 TaxID=3032202 RepID=UPI0024A50776|nr:tryptophan 7-halogenase [Actinoplanes sp. NBRC 103695]GLY94071.1 hypothetical protein Acsp02_13270 [Actinoplanes sp. NBRC 103695]